MRVVHVLRKPLTGSVAETVVQHGTGALHINACRITTVPDDPNHRPGTTEITTDSDSMFGMASRRRGNLGEGRWPANLVLEHLPGCRHLGITKLRAPKHRNPSDGDSKFCHGEVMTRPDRGRYDLTDEDGNETVDTWDCEPGCPVAGLDSQGEAMGAHAAGAARAAKREAGKTGLFPMDGDGHRFGDSGGVARFFKQVGGLSKKSSE